MNARFRIVVSILFGSGLLLTMMLALTSGPKTTLAEPMQLNASESLVKQLGGQARAVAKQGDYVYLGIGSRLDVIDVQDPAHPIQVGQTGFLTKEITSLYMIGDLAIAPVDYNLYIFDLSDPLTPTLTQTYPLLGVRIYDFVLSGTLAFVAESGGMRILDFSDPLNPVQISLSLEGHWVNSIAVFGDIAYIGFCEMIDESGCASRFAIWNISDLSAPFEISKSSTSSIVSQAIYNGYLYRVESSGGIDIFDLSVPATPTKVGEFNRGLNRIKIMNDQAILMSTSSICVYDLLPAPIYPVELGCTSYWLAGAIDALIDGSELFVAFGNNGLRIADVTQTGLPEIGHFKPFGAVIDVAKVDSYVYVLDFRSDLRVLDTTKPITPVEVFVYDHVYHTQIVADGNDIFMGGTNDVQIIDVTDPVSPTLRTTYTPSSSSNKMVVNGDYAYLLIFDPFYSSLEVVDISDRDNPTYVTSAGKFGNRGVDMVIVGNYAYVSEYSSSGGVLTIIDIATPASPQIVATQPVSYDPGPIVYINDHIYMGNYGVQIIDVTNPTIPQPAGRFTVTGATNFDYEVSVVDGMLYVFARDANYDPIKVMFDVTNPTAPVELGAYEYAEGLRLAGATYVPAYGDGLLIYSELPSGDEHVYLPVILRSP